MPARTGEKPLRGPVTVDAMRIHVVDHPLVAHKLTTLRDKRTDSPTFRRLADELVTLLAYEATRDVRTEQVDIETPVTPTTGVKLSHPRPLVVPILRAGLGMLDGMVRLLPTAEVGFLGMIRNEETLQAETYATRMPEDLSGRQVYVLDPMLATGGTLVAAIRELIKRGADDVTAVVLLAAPEGVEVMERELAGDPGHRRDGIGRRAAQRERLHRAGARGRGRPDVRHRRLTCRRGLRTALAAPAAPAHGASQQEDGAGDGWVRAVRAVAAAAGVLNALNFVPMIRSTSFVLRVSVFCAAPGSWVASTGNEPFIAVVPPSSTPVPGTFLSYAAGALSTLPMAKPRFLSSSAAVLASPLRGVAL